MKKILITIIFILLFSFDVKANDLVLNMEFQDNIYYVRRGSGYSSNILSFYTIDSKVAYCVEPGVLITNFNYISEDSLDNLNLSLEIKELISLIGYYGYEYENHHTTRFRMATQALIWEVVTKDIVEFYTERYGYGNYIDVSYEKNIIMNLVGHHYIKPSFDSNNYSLYLNQEIEIIDTNNILSLYEVVDDNSNLVKIDGNKLIINPLNIGKNEIILRKKKYDNDKSILYIPTDSTSQKVAHLRSDDLLVKINLDVKGGYLILEKLDYDTKDKPLGDNTLNGALYGVYDINNNLITTLETNNKVKSKYLSLGNYKLKEIKPSYGYLKDETVYNFSITENNLEPKITVFEKPIKKEITIKKLLGHYTNNEKYFKIEPDIIFDIYLKSNNQLITSLKTDENGYIKTSLSYGTYIFKQRNTTNGYLKTDDFLIVIDENTTSIDKIIINKPITTLVKVNKIDLDTGEKINVKGIKFKIKDLETNEYVCFNSCFYETDENGSFNTNGLFGHFQLEEVDEKTNSYLWNQEPIKFNVLGTTKEITINFPNERIKGGIKILKTGEKFDNQDGIKYLEIPLPSVKFNLYASDNIYFLDKLIYKKDELVDTLITDENGIGEFNNLYLGTYYLEEIESSNLNLVNKEKYYFNLEYIDQYNHISKTLEIKNYLPKGNIELNKIDSNTKEGIPNTLIEISLDDKMIYRGKTNEFGKINLDNLPLGNYQLKEIESNKDYIKTDKILEFSITQDKEMVKLVLENEKRKEEIVENKKELEKDEIIQIVEVPNTALNSNSILSILGVVLLLFGTCLLIYSLKQK